jgi:oligopeptide transport system permease protein
MATYLIRRLLWTLVTLFFICLITFLLMHAVPGGPFEVRAGERGASEAFLRTTTDYYGLNDPLPKQFVRMLGNILQGDLGLSFSQRGQRVTDLMLDKIKPSFLLGTMSFILVVGVGIPTGIIAAVKRNSVWDYISLGISTTLAAIPNFVMAFFMLLIFAIGLGWVDVRLGKGFGDSIASLPNGILPALALGAPAMALLSRLTRGAMIEVLDQDYMRTARAKGLNSSTVYLRHGLRNALIPVMTLLGPIFAGLITGSIIIESIFGLPGIGAAFVNSVAQRDYGMIMGTTLFYAIVIMLMNLIVDMVYPLLDPRVKVG